MRNEINNKRIKMFRLTGDIDYGEEKEEHKEILVLVEKRERYHQLTWKSSFKSIEIRMDGW